MAEYKLFPGCFIQNRIPFLEASAKFVFDQVGVSQSAGNFGCCPNPVGLRFVDEKTWAVLGARNLVEAESEGKNIMSLCNGCYQSMAVVNHELKHDPMLKAEVNKVLAEVGKNYAGSISVEHFVRVLHEEVGIEKIKSKITHPLTGLKVALHPGCHYARPSHILKGEDPFNMHFLRDLVEASGATVVDYDQEDLCCGNGVRNADPYTANTMLKAKIDDARIHGADCFAVNCPACFQNMDAEQRNLKSMAAEGVKYNFPTYYVTELLAMAMGKTAKEIGINFHRNKGKDELMKVGL